MQYQKLINYGIKRLREKLELTQEQFAEKIDVSNQGLSNLERNKYQPQSETIDKICKAFNVSPIDLLLDYPDKMDNNELLVQITSLLRTYSQKDLEKLYKVLIALKH